MPRTIVALYDSRAEAEQARALLASEVKVNSARVIGKDTAAAVDTLKIAKRDAETYRDSIRRGAHLLVAEVPSGTNARRVVELLERPAGDGAETDASAAFDEPQQAFRVTPAEPEGEEAAAKASAPEPSAARAADEPRAEQPPQPSASPAVAEQERVPAGERELRIGKPQVALGGARVRSFTRETPAEEQVSLNDENIEVETRPSGRQLSDAEVEDGGLFKERVFEIAEMREEPVVTKVAVVREEVIVRKTVKQRTETVRDTVRHTEVQVEDLEGAAPTFLASDTDSKSRRR